jgi:hypothetical protein
MRQSTEKFYEDGIDLKKLFIDFRQAFDSVKGKVILNAMRGLESDKYYLR